MGITGRFWKLLKARDGGKAEKTIKTHVGRISRQLKKTLSQTQSEK